MTRKAGSLVLERLRDRILVGRYFGHWSPGDRLPSVRDVARIEAVDRKTVAAAYRRLQREGLVRIEPRSGVYLGGEAPWGGDPLRRLHAQWLEHAVETAWDLGLDAVALSGLFRVVAEVQRRPLLVTDPDQAHAAMLASEVQRRSGLRCLVCRPEELRQGAGPPAEALLVLLSPRTDAGLLPRDGVPRIWATLSSQLLLAVARAAAAGPLAVWVGTVGLERELRRALEVGLVQHADRVRVLRATPGRPDTRLRRDTDGRRVVLWPGADDARLTTHANAGLEDLRRADLLSPATLRCIRGEVVRATLQGISTSSAVAAT